MTTDNKITHKQIEALDKRIEELNEAGLGGLLSGPWIDKYQEKYNNEVIDYLNGEGEKPEIVFVS